MGQCFKNYFSLPLKIASRQQLSTTEMLFFSLAMSQPQILFFWLKSGIKILSQIPTTPDFPTLFQKINILPWNKFSLCMSYFPLFAITSPHLNIFQAQTPLPAGTPSSILLSYSTGLLLGDSFRIKCPYFL